MTSYNRMVPRKGLLNFLPGENFSLSPGGASHRFSFFKPPPSQFLNAQPLLDGAEPGGANLISPISHEGSEAFRGYTKASINVLNDRSPLQSGSLGSRDDPRSLMLSSPARLNVAQPVRSPTRTENAVRVAGTGPRPHRLGDLSARYESNGDPGKISTGRHDPGGVSYGSYQFSVASGNALRFVRSAEFAPWAGRFVNLQPNTPEFNRQWQAVAKEDPAAFEAAQHKFWQRLTYDPVVKEIRRTTGYDINASNPAVRDVAWSFAVNHGAARKLLAEAIETTSKEVSRDDPSFEEKLINNMYDRRTEYVRTLRDRAANSKKPGEANTFNNMIEHRFPQERAEALRMLRDGAARR